MIKWCNTSKMYARCKVNPIYKHIASVWIGIIIASGVCVLLLFSFLFLHFSTFRDKFYYSSLFTHCSRTVHKTHNYFIDPQLLYSEKKIYIKNGTHSTIQTFKNYFATVFSVFNFQFSVSAKISNIQTDP